MRPRIDLTGQRFGRLTVRACVGKQNRRALWQCKCDCGTVCYINTDRLRSGNTQSCGCLKRESIAKGRNRTHGQSKTKLYHIWYSIMQRCYDEKFRFYHHYGGRGIKVCEEWHDRDAFTAWAMENGFQDGLSIERKDVNGEYCPENCCWITKGEQQHNKRNTIYVDYHGEQKPLWWLAEQAGINRRTLLSRIEHGWDIDDAMTRPVEKKKSRRSVCETETATKKKYAGAIIAQKGI